MPTLTVRPSGRSISLEAGQTMLAALQALGESIACPCGGGGVCGKCRVRVLSGEVEPPGSDEEALLTSADEAAGIRLACLARVCSDVSVEVVGAHCQGEDAAVLVRSACAAQLDVARDAGLSGLGVALDIGTTTMAAALIDLASGAELAQASCLNGQTRFGADVLTRISYENAEGTLGIEKLQQAVIASTRDLIADLCAQVGAHAAAIRHLAVAANCVMTHMFLGVDARSLGRAPYEPAFTQAQRTSAACLDLELAPDAEVYCLPQAGAYVGGDVVGGAFVCGLRAGGPASLLVDIGTNGELVLACGDTILCSSCAVGPALEGMNITAGMRAVAGAVEEVRINDAGVVLQTISGCEPTGVCGSGVLAAVREGLRAGLIKTSGALARPGEVPGALHELVREDERGRALVLCTNPELLLTQGDVRQVQLAKGALLSGVTALLDKAGVDAADLANVYVAGQFGAHVSVSSIIGVGLLPPTFRRALRYVGNTSLAAARLALVSSRARREMERFARAMDSVDLATLPGYERLFARCTRFPAA